MDLVLQWDIRLLHFIHEDCNNALFDVILPLLRNKYIWLPSYIGIITYLLTRYQLWKSSYLLLLIVSAVAFTDFSSGQLLKKYVQRVRPCMDTVQADHVIAKVRCSYSYSFPSSHAANHFGLAVILSFLFGTYRKWLPPLLYLWALLISLAQVYVGIHYPLDVIGGAILGIMIVRILIKLCALWLPKEVFVPDY